MSNQDFNMNDTTGGDGQRARPGNEASNTNNGSNVTNEGTSANLISENVDFSYQGFRNPKPHFNSAYSVIDLNKISNKDEVINAQFEYIKAMEEKIDKLKQEKNQFYKYTNVEEDDDYGEVLKSNSSYERELQKDIVQAIKMLAERPEKQTNNGDREKNLNNTQKTFAGRMSENVDQWVATLNLNMEAANIKEARKMIVAAGYLTDAALQFYQQEDKKRRLEWRSFQIDLIKRFRPANFQDVLLSKLNEMQQKGSLSKHIENFTILINQAEGIPEHVKKYLFIKSLNENVSSNVNFRKPKDLDEAIQIARDFEESFIRASNDETGVAVNYARYSRYNRPQQNVCYQCGKPGHRKNECSFNRSKNFNSNYRYQQIDRPMSRQQNPPYQQGQSFQQNQQYQQGQQFQQNQSYQQSQTTQQKLSNRSNLNCTFCGKSRHTEAECYKKQKMAQDFQNGQESPMEINNVVKTKPKPASVKTVSIFEPQQILLQTVGKINGFKERMIFDSGATCCVISENIAKQYNVQVSEEKVNVEVADGRKEEAYMSEEVTITIFGISVDVRMIILNKNDKPILIGLDWMTEAGAIIDLGNKSIRFGARSYNFNEADDYDSEELADYQTLQCAISEIELDDSELDVEISLFDEKETKESINKTNTENLKHLNDEQAKEILKLMEEFSDIFADSLNDLREPAKMNEFVITTTDEIPVVCPSYRINEKHRQVIKEEIDKLLDAGIIRESDTPYSAQALAIPKKDKTVRTCIDFRKLNKKTVRSQHPITRQDDIFDRLAEAKIYSTFDLKSGFFQMPLHKDSIPKTGFSTQDGHYEFLRMPMGVTNGIAEFCKAIKAILGNCKNVEIYIDDVVVFSNSFEEHLLHLRNVLIIFKERNLKINRKKCAWAQEEIKLLGHIISANSLKMDPEKIKAIKDWKTPSKVVHIQQFLGITGYYRRFIEHYSAYAFPLNELIKKDVKWVWSPECDKVFNLLKEKLISYPILQKPNFNKPFILHTDASGTWIGAVLTQKDELGREYNCYYYSCILKGAEIHYGITEKECLAIVKAVKHFRVYLFNHFTIVTDHAALKWLMDKTEPTGRLARWTMFLQAFDFTILHRAGRKHCNADALSRPILSIMASTSGEAEHKDIQASLEEEANLSSADLDPHEDEFLLHFLRTGKFVVGSSNQQRKRIIKIAGDYKLERGILYYARDDMFKIIPEPNKRLEIVTAAHHNGHFKVETTYNRLKEKFYWRDLMRDIEHVISQCIRCLKYSKIRVNEHPALALNINSIFDRCGIDMIGGLFETVDGYKYILVIIDALSKYPYAVATKTKSAIEIAKHFFNYISLFGAPKELVSDQGKEFLNEVIKELANVSGIEHIVTSSYNARTNGHTERYNQTLMECLRKLADENKENWPDYLPFALMAYRSRVHTSTRFSPYQLAFGKQMNELIDYTKVPDENVNDELALDRRISEICRQYEDYIDKAKINVGKAQRIQKTNQDKHHKIVENLKPGTKVYIKAPHLLLKKLDERFIGPYTVHTVSQRGNYWLLNEYDELLKNSYPITKLKVAERSEEEVYVMEVIRDMRIVDLKREFLVKWLDYPEDDNTWVSEDQFTDIDLIEEYFASKSDQLAEQVEYESDVDNEINNEKREHEKLCFRVEKTSMFMNKNTVSLAILSSSNLEMVSNIENKAMSKFKEHKQMLQENNVQVGECIEIKDSYRRIFYLFTETESIQNQSLEVVENTLEKLIEKCKMLKISKLALSKQNLSSNKYSWKEVTALLQRLFSSKEVKITIHDNQEEIVNTGTSIRNTRNSNKNVLLTLLCIFLNLLAVFADEKVEGKFKYCSSSLSSNIILSKGNCEVQNQQPFTVEVNTLIVDEMSYKLYGDGYACRKKRIDIEKTFHWYFAKSQIINELEVIMSRIDCDIMIQTRKCEGKQMNCSDSYCAYDGKPESHFSYGQTNTFTGYSCQFDKLLIHSNDLNRKIFSDSQSSCLAHDLYCVSKGLTIIWSQDIIHECPFQFIKQAYFNMSDNIWTSDKERLLFQTTRKLKFCNTYFFETTEGFYLVPGNITINLPKVDKEIKSMHHLILSDIDYKELTNAKRSRLLSNKINENLCKTLKMVLTVFEKQHNKYLTINDITGNEMVLFNNDGLILIADCVNISSVTIQTNMKACLSFPEVSFTLFNKKYSMSLFDDHIVSFNKEVKTNCKARKLTLLPNNKLIITLNGTNEIVDIDNKLKEIGLTELEKEELDFGHSSLFKEDFDPIKQIEKLTKLRELNGHYYFVPEVAQHHNTSEEIAQQFVSIKDFIDKVLNKLPYILTIIALVVGVYFITSIYFKCKNNKKEAIIVYNKPSSSKEEDVEIKLLEEDKKSDECKENKTISGTETIQVSVQQNASNFADESKSLINEILKRKDKL